MDSHQILSFYMGKFTPGWKGYLAEEPACAYEPSAAAVPTPPGKG
ncbi:MAG: hypothetical protein WCO56_20020 [Verrucomicrobiota bacterium]